MGKISYYVLKHVSFLPILWLFAISIAQAQQTLTIDAAKVLGQHSTTPLNTVGAGRANEGLRADWQAQLATIQQDIGFHYIRFHGLLHDDMGVYNEDSQGNAIYNFQYVDALYDELLSQHIRPFVEISFMPAKLASDSRTVFWWKANVSPPKDMARWNDLIKALMTQWRTRYGEAEINQWYYEVWNEPNLHNVFFTGNMEDYFSLYQNTAEFIRSVCPHCRVGGPATAGAVWINEVIDFTKTKNIPVDFVSTHKYAVTHGDFDADGHTGTILDTKPTALTSAVRGSQLQRIAHASFAHHRVEQQLHTD